MIWIRADANKEIGMGHVMRCLSVARALNRYGEQTCFITADTSAGQLLENAGQAYRVLETDYDDMEKEIPELEKIVSQDKPKVMLVDSYFATSEYIRRVREIVPVGYMDDKCREDISVDILINYNIFAERTLYSEQEKKTRFLLGLQYVPLREEFEGAEYVVRERTQRVLLTTGGSDKFNLTDQLLRRALEDENVAGLHYSVISGIYNMHFKELEQIAAKHENVEICCNVNNMPDLMRKSDIAVSAGGTTMYELSAIGVPTICFSFVDNQERIVESFREKQLVCYGGNYLRQGDSLFTEITEHIGKLAYDKELRQAYSRMQRTIIDGKGAMRIAKELIRFGQEDSAFGQTN